MTAVLSITLLMIMLFNVPVIGRIFLFISRTILLAAGAVLFLLVLVVLLGSA